MRVSCTGAAFIRATTTPARVLLPVRFVSMRMRAVDHQRRRKTSWPSSRGDGNGFAGQLLLVDQPDAAEHRAVHRDLVARIDDDDVADDHLLQGHLDLNAIALDPGELAQGIQQVQVGPRAAPRRQVADDLARFDQADHQGRREEEPGGRQHGDGGRVEEVDVQLVLVANGFPGAFEGGQRRRDEGGADQQRRHHQPRQTCRRPGPGSRPAGPGACHS